MGDERWRIDMVSHSGSVAKIYGGLTGCGRSGNGWMGIAVDSMNRIRPEEMISVRNRRYPSGIDRIRCLKPLTFVIDVMNVDGGDERLTAHPDAPI